jgi:L-fuconolactonase
VRSRELPAALRLVQEHPHLTFVLDHLAKPEIAAGRIEPWASLLSPFGACTNVSAKVSGLVTEADWHRWRLPDLLPYVRHALDVFGPTRLMFGSDWPVCLLAAQYQQVFDAAVDALDGLRSDELAAVLGGSAVRAYDLTDLLLGRPDRAG